MDKGKEFLIYLSILFKKTTNKPIAITGTVSFLLSILAGLNAWFRWIEDSTMNFVLLIIPTAVFIITLVICAIFAPYLIYRDQKRDKKELKDVNTKIEAELIEVRRKLREKEDAQVKDIPQTLKQIVTWYETITKDKLKTKVDIDILQKVLSELFDVESVKELTDIKKLSHKTVTRLSKKLKKRMRIKRGDKKAELEWAKKIYTTMDNNNVGIDRNNNSEYTDLRDKLEFQTDFITETPLYDIIWNYIDNSYASYSIRLFVELGDVKAVIQYFPPQVRNYLNQLDEKITRAAGSGRSQINFVLEKYRTGEHINE